MSRPQCLDLFRFGLFVVACCVVSSCAKKISPQAIKQAEFAWNLKTLVSAYQLAGSTDARWDDAATRALTAFAHLRSGTVPVAEDANDVITTNCAAAVAAGCDDPLVRYLNIRFSMSQSASPEEVATAFCDTARDMQKSSYPNVRKFYASIRAFDQLYYAYGSNSMSMPVFREVYGFMVQDFMPTIQDPALPAEEAYEVSKEYLKEFQWNADRYEQEYAPVEQTLLKNWPDASQTWLLKGEAYYRMAWNARGTGYAKDLSADQQKTFFEKLAVAEPALEKAWKLDPTDARIPTFMIGVAEATQKERSEMETWFNRAMALNPNNYEACKAKLHYLYPQWYGSRDDMIAFGKECLSSKVWGGSVPLILVDAHSDYVTYCLDNDAEKEAYWKQPDVWSDVKASFDRFFEMNPDAVQHYRNYAWYAFHAEQWDAFNQIVLKLGPADYYFFGGKDQLDKMVQYAKDRTHMASSGQ
jgi:tetratricopeptide (TPR) repeat protein